MQFLNRHFCRIHSNVYSVLMLVTAGWYPDRPKKVWK